jgi:hypothetical protein
MSPWHNSWGTAREALNQCVVQEGPKASPVRVCSYLFELSVAFLNVGRVVPGADQTDNLTFSGPEYTPSFRTLHQLLENFAYIFRFELHSRKEIDLLPLSRCEEVVQAFLVDAGDSPSYGTNGSQWICSCWRRMFTAIHCGGSVRAHRVGYGRKLLETRKTSSSVETIFSCQKRMFCHNCNPHPSRLFLQERWPSSGDKLERCQSVSPPWCVVERMR